MDEEAINNLLNEAKKYVYRVRGGEMSRESAVSAIRELLRSIKLDKEPEAICRAAEAMVRIEAINAAGR